MWINSAKLILISIILLMVLIVTILYMSDSFFYTIIMKIKPTMITKINNFLLVVTNLLIRNEYDYFINYKNENKELELLKCNNMDMKIIEQDLFVVDSLIGMFKMLSFALGKDYYNSNLYEDICEYFMCYCALFNSEKSIIAQEEYDEFDNFVSCLEEIGQKYKINRNDGDLVKSNKYKKIHDEQATKAKEFSDFLNKKQEYLNSILETKKKKIIQVINKILEEKSHVDS